MKVSVMRADLAVDIKGVPVSFFQDAARAAYKRIMKDIEHPNRIVRIGRSGVETMTIGARPNLFRVYNKAAEREHQYGLLARRAKKQGYSIPTYQELYGHPREVLLTRVERQYGGGRLPEELCTVGALYKNAASVDPFAPLQFSVSNRPEPNPDDYDLTTFLAGLGLRQRILEHGLQRTRALVNKKSAGNAARTFRKFADFLPALPQGMEVPDLNTLFRQSIERQFRV